MGEKIMKNFICDFGINCNQSCVVALVFSTKLYRKLAVSLFLCVRSFLISSCFNFLTAELIGLGLWHTFSQYSFA